MNILLVDDEEIILNALAKYLTKRGHQVQTAENGDQAWMLFHKNPASIDLIMTDIRMSKLDGVALVKRVREKGFDTPVIFVSGYIEKEITHEITALGAIKCLRKPFGFGELLEVLNSCNIQ